MFFRFVLFLLSLSISATATAKDSFYGFVNPAVEFYGLLDSTDWVYTISKDTQSCFVRPPYSRRVEFSIIDGEYVTNSLELSVAYNVDINELACVSRVFQTINFGEYANGVTVIHTGRRSKRYSDDLFYGHIGSVDLYVGGVREPQRFSNTFLQRDIELVDACLISSRLNSIDVVFDVFASGVDDVRLFAENRFLDNDNLDAVSAYACLYNLVGREYPDQITHAHIALVYSFQRDVVLSSAE